MGLLEFRRHMQSPTMLDILKGTPPADITGWKEVWTETTTSDVPGFIAFLDRTEESLAHEHDSIVYRMNLCLREGVPNYAVKNNGSDPNKHVTLSKLCNGHSVCFDMAGEGGSFWLGKICRSSEQCKAEGKLLIPSGRGNMLMKEYSDFMAYTLEDNERRLGGKRLYLGFTPRDSEDAR